MRTPTPQRTALALIVATLFPVLSPLPGQQAAGAAKQGRSGAAAKPSLTLRQTLVGTPEWVSFYSGVPSVEWAPDGKHLVVPVGGGRKAWLDPATRRTSRPADGSVERAEAMAAALQKLGLEASRAKELAVRAKPGAGHDANNEPRTLCVHEGSLLYTFDVKTGRAARLSPDDATKYEVELSPDGQRVAFVRDHNLIVANARTGAETPLSQDGTERMLYGRLDWVYQEEIYGRGDFRGHWWSPTGQHLAYLRLDESPVKTFMVVDHVPDRSLEKERSVLPEPMNYPKAGDPNPVVSLGVADVNTGETVWLKMPTGDGYDDEILVVYVDWHPSGDRVVFQVQNRIQTWLDLCYGDPKTGAVTRVLRETSKAWVNRLANPKWLADGSFLWLSERTGYKHVYRYGADGKLMGAVTGGNWQVREIQKVDLEGDKIWFTGTKDGVVDDHLYRCRLGDGSAANVELTRLTTTPGVHKVHLNADGSRFLDECSSLTQPPELRLCDGADGKVIGKLQVGRVRGTATHAFRSAELVKIPNRDGFAMDAKILKPVDMQPGQKYPVLLDIYGGPDTPVFNNSWNRGASTWHQFLAEQGVIVFQVNNRSASGAGQMHTATCYKQFNVTELRDFLDALDWLGEQGYADLDRVAINGWSFGGSMAAFALCKSDRFKLGFAGAGVYDWRLYDTIYTERYMDTPQRNPEGYAKTSVLNEVDNLHGHLVVLHGTMDDNVHLQNAMCLILALHKAEKDFELMLYPKSRHGVVDRDMRWSKRRTMWRNIREHLLRK